MTRFRLLLAAGAAVAAFTAVALRTDAADHKDSPAVLDDPASDLNDLYAWVDTDNDRLIVAATMYQGAPPTAAFATDTGYVFHVASQDDLLAPTSQTAHQIIATFDQNGDIHVWLDGTHVVSGDPGAAAGLSGGGVRVFAGLRDDPFFFNIIGFVNTATLVHDAATSLTFDAAGCPALDEATAGVLVDQLAHGSDGADPVDYVRGFNVLAIVVEVDLALLTDGGDVLGVWASTHQLQ